MPRWTPLMVQSLVYPCSCSRRETGGAIYQGTCRNGVKDPRRNPMHGAYASIRLKKWAISLFSALMESSLISWPQLLTMRNMALPMWSAGPTSSIPACAKSTYRNCSAGRNRATWDVPGKAVKEAGEKAQQVNLLTAIECGGTCARTVKMPWRFLGQAIPEGATPGEVLAAAVADWKPARIPKGSVRRADNAVAHTGPFRCIRRQFDGDPVVALLSSRAASHRALRIRGRIARHVSKSSRTPLPSRGGSPNTRRVRGL